MALQNRELYKFWAMRLSIATMIIVILLSWLNELKFFDIMVRAGVSFGVMYLLMIGSLNLFERTAPQKLQDTQTEVESGRGGNIDFSVGDEELLGSPGQDPGLPGQIDRDLSSGLPNSERQAEIVKRMGWQ